LGERHLTTNGQRFSRRRDCRGGARPDIAGTFLGDDTDWDDVAALLAASHRVLAPRKLAKLVM
jgi:hypothetical protein